MDGLPAAEEYFYTDLGKIPGSISSPAVFQEAFSGMAGFNKKQYLSTVPPLGMEAGFGYCFLYFPLNWHY